MSKNCDPKDIALKSFFLGPQSENADWVKGEIDEIFRHWFSWRKNMFSQDGSAISQDDLNSEMLAMRRLDMVRSVNQLLKIYEKEIPTFTPRYVGHMVSEISLPAILGQILNLLHNPNNISEEVSKVGLLLEDEAIKMLAKMIGYDQAVGHFTSGGTVANIEAIWRARFNLDNWIALGTYLQKKEIETKNIFEYAHMGWDSYRSYRKTIGEEKFREFSFVVGNPFATLTKVNSIFRTDYEGPVILVPGNKHYSWQKGLSLLGFGSEAFWPIAINKYGKLDVASLHKNIEQAARRHRPILMVVSVVGTTELGELDPVHEVQHLLDEYKKKGIHIWHHVDAAYGGFYCTLLGNPKEESELSESATSALKAMKEVDSVTLDPHKLGYVPYACGAFLAKNEERYKVTNFAAPYLVSGDNERKNNGKWLSTLEGSRSASGAAATWLTGKSIGFNSEGYGRILTKGIEARKLLEQKLAQSLAQCRIIPYADTNILCFCITGGKENVSKVNERSLKIYEKSNIESGFMISKTSLEFKDYGAFATDFVASWQGVIDCSGVTLLRVVLMNPFFNTKEMNVDFAEEFVKWVQNIANSVDD